MDVAVAKYNQQPLLAAEPAAGAGPAKPVVASMPATAARFQLASYMDRPSAEKAVRSLGSKYSGAIGGSTLTVATGTAKGRTVYRVQGGASSKTDAEAICGRVKAKGGTCVLAR
jgi:hypothetical protein